VDHTGRHQLNRVLTHNKNGSEKRRPCARVVLDEWRVSVEAYTQRYHVADAAEWYAMSQAGVALLTTLLVCSQNTPIDGSLYGPRSQSSVTRE
jgi:hypothetical protein